MERQDESKFQTWLNLEAESCSTKFLAVWCAYVVSIVVTNLILHYPYPVTQKTACVLYSGVLSFLHGYHPHPSVIRWPGVLAIGWALLTVYCILALGKRPHAPGNNIAWMSGFFVFTSCLCWLGRRMRNLKRKKTGSV